MINCIVYFGDSFQVRLLSQVYRLLFEQIRSNPLHFISFQNTQPASMATFALEQYKWTGFFLAPRPTISN